MPYLTPEQKTYLIGKRYEAEKHCHGAKDGYRGNQYSKNEVKGQKDLLPKYKSTAEKIAKEVGCAEVMVKRAEHFAQALDKVATVQTDM